MQSRRRKTKQQLKFAQNKMLFNLIQTKRNEILLINLLKEDYFSHIGVPVINLTDRLSELFPGVPEEISSEEEIMNYLNKDDDNTLDMITSSIKDISLKKKFNKRKRFYIFIISNRSDIPNSFFEEHDLKEKEQIDYHYLENCEKIDSSNILSGIKKLQIYLKNLQQIRESRRILSPRREENSPEKRYKKEKILNYLKNGAWIDGESEDLSNTNDKSSGEGSKDDEFSRRKHKDSLSVRHSDDSDEEKEDILFPKKKKQKSEEKITVYKIDLESRCEDKKKKFEENLGQWKEKIKGTHEKKKEIIDKSVEVDYKSFKKAMTSEARINLEKLDLSTDAEMLFENDLDDEEEDQSNLFIKKKKIIFYLKFLIKKKLDLNEKMGSEVRTFLIGLRLSLLLSNSRHRETYILKEGCDSFYKSYNYIRKDYKYKLYKLLKTPGGIPSEIIPGHLWIGDGHHVKKIL